MRSDRPAPILVEHPPRDLPNGELRFSLQGAPADCCRGAFFVDELFRERRISSVEWEVLGQAIWPHHPRSGKALLAVKDAP